MSLKSEIQQLLNKYEITPNKVLGQNFLIEKRYILDLIVAAEISKDDTILEVGPGTGEITKELATRAKKVVAIEKDPNMVRILKNELRGFENVKIVQEDILKFSIIPERSRRSGINGAGNGPACAEDTADRQFSNYKLVGAPPYYLTGRLFRKFLEDIKDPPQTIAVIIQEGIAEKIMAQPPKSSLLAISVQLYGRAMMKKRVPKDAFWPKPNVNSAILTISDIKKPKINEKEFFRVLKAGFSSPRKQLAVNFARELKISRPDVENLLKKADINPSARAETLKLEDWLRLAKS